MLAASRGLSRLIGTTATVRWLHGWPGELPMRGIDMGGHDTYGGGGIYRDERVSWGRRVRPLVG